MEIKNLQTKVDNWIKKHGVRYFNELTNMAQLTEEVGEVARIIARKYGEQSFKKSDEKISLDDELSDVLFVLLCLANQLEWIYKSLLIKDLSKKQKEIMIDITLIPS